MTLFNSDHNFNLKYCHLSIKYRRLLSLCQLNHKLIYKVINTLLHEQWTPIGDGSGPYIFFVLLFCQICGVSGFATQNTNKQYSGTTHLTLSILRGYTFIMYPWTSPLVSTSFVKWKYVIFFVCLNFQQGIVHSKYIFVRRVTAPSRRVCPTSRTTARLAASSMWPSTPSVSSWTSASRAESLPRGSPSESNIWTTPSAGKNLLENLTSLASASRRLKVVWHTSKFSSVCRQRIKRPNFFEW